MIKKIKAASSFATAIVVIHLIVLWYQIQMWISFIVLFPITVSNLDNSIAVHNFLVAIRTKSMQNMRVVKDWSTRLIDEI